MPIVQSDTLNSMEASDLQEKLDPSNEGYVAFLTPLILLGLSLFLLIRDTVRLMTIMTLLSVHGAAILWHAGALFTKRTFTLVCTMVSISNHHHQR